MENTCLDVGDVSMTVDGQPATGGGRTTSTIDLMVLTYF